MINPSQAIEVKFLFMLLDNDPDGQAALLAQVMDFLANTPANELREVFNFTDPSAIYAFLEQNKYIGWTKPPSDNDQGVLLSRNHTQQNNFYCRHILLL